MNGIILPFLIIISGMVLAKKIRLSKILRPKRFIKDLSTASLEVKSSPFKSMCTALAGTLGVGNIAGVSTAIISGGAGAVFWMWVGAVFSMSVKYGEVSLAVKYRNHDSNGSFSGGAMYTMKKGMKKYIGKRNAYILGGIFAILCISNSFIMGNLIQSNAACSVFRSRKELIGIILSICLIMTAIAGFKRISNVAFCLIPPLSAVYIILSLSIIVKYYYLIPNLFVRIVKCAFSVKSVVGGVYGYGIKEALRFGMTRGIFSNEAGCGTSPSAHASANVRSPHHQGCFGIFEVIADTLILCSMTAFVILISDSICGTDISSDGISLALSAFGNLLGAWAYYLIGTSVILFAFATLIAQLYYGDVAIGYFTEKAPPRLLFVIFSVVLCYAGAVIDASSVWIWADIIIGVMTVINTSVLLILRNQVQDISRIS
ncbi:MAG: amino acid carrier protein [Clostridia bacterium]|nr:amino acid carrier protein [Clostridia bacterium]